MNRREFLSGTAAACIAAGMAHAAGADRLRCGVLGLGHAHAIDIVRELQLSPDFELAGVCEPDETVRAAYANEAALQGVPWLAQDALLGAPDIRMIAVESDVPRLLPFGRAAVDAGKHLHLDKPPGVSLPEFRALLDSAAKQNLLVQMGYMFRYNPGFDFLRRMASEGALGKIYAVHGSICTDLSPDKRRRNAFHPGGIMLELGCHLIDMIVLLLGAPKEVTSFLRYDGPLPDGLNDNTLAVLDYDHAMATVEVSAQEPGAGGARRFKIAGINGSIILSPLEAPVARLSLRNAHGDHPAGVSNIEFPDRPRHRLDLADLAAGIRGERPFAYTGAHDYAVQQTLLRACGESV
ncbi:MAG: Gfo/Idh/MocA family oxidoreductase [Candidatus Hydrogenedentes bacterium]|nr:Gfo/Idh/MocA family oxidoreductase [Candidatus Hydrogenedentota bacterium]